MKKKFFQRLLLCGALFNTTGGAFAQGIEFLHDEPLEKILGMAHEQHRIIFIDGYTEHCAPCKQLDKETFPLQKVGDYFNSNFINVKYDLDKPEGKKVMAQYKDVITGFPSLILMDENGKMIHKIGGFHTADSLIAKMKAGLNGHSLSAMRARLQAGEKSIVFVQEYMSIMRDGYLRDEIEEVSRKILDRLSDEEMLNPQMWTLVGRSVTDPYSPIFGRVVKNYWNFSLKKVTDLGLLEYQLRTAIQIAIDDIVKPEEKDGKLVLKTAPEKEAILSGYISNTDNFKHTEAMKAQLEVYHLALTKNWTELTSALKFYNKIEALGYPATLTFPYVQYMKQFCKEKSVLTAASDLLASIPKEKMAGYHL